MSRRGADEAAATSQRVLVPSGAAPSAVGVDENVADLHRALLREHIGEPLEAIARSVSVPDTRPGNEEASALKAPGGFRRGFLHSQAASQGIPLEQRPHAWKQSLVESLQPLIRVIHFEGVMGIYIDDEGQEVAPSEGHSGRVATILAIAKSFVGSGITFLPGAVAKGGWLFAPIALVVIAMFNAFCIRLLLRCSAHVGSPSFAEIAYRAVGCGGKLAVQISLVVSQFGTNVAFMIFVAQIVGSMGLGDLFSVGQMFAAQLVFLIPLSFIRNLHRLEVPILGADVLIFFGLVVVLGYSVTRIAAAGAGPGLQAFRPDTCGLFIGTATFTFEGIPMVLPIKQSMAEPQQYWALFVKVFSGVVMFFVSFALIGYVAFGDAVHSIVILDLPAADPLVQAVKAAYACALILGSPLTFLPGGRITELWVFGESRQKGQWKWQKNALRTAEFCAFAVIGVYGGQYFEKFIALTGALCCAPIALIYPPLFHWRLCASSAFEKIIDAVLLAIGCAVGTLVFYQAVAM